MTIARSDVVSPGAEGVFHCISRCVRRAFLCGDDPYDGRSYEHRREWIRERLKVLASAFGIEVCAYAVMSNHLHLVVRTRPDVVENWDDSEVARRWDLLFSSQSKRVQNIEDAAAKRYTSPERLRELRSRLGSVSWFMRCLNENIARRANREDGLKGRFWEGRFKCQALLDESADLACMMYVDLNPIRAGLAKTPEKSEFTSAQERIQERQTQKKKPIQPKADTWLCSIEQILPITIDEYLDLLDWTGRQLAYGKKGKIPARLAPILTRLEINDQRWLSTVNNFGSLFHRAAGRLDSMTRAAKETGLNWLRGLRAGKRAFSAA